VTSRDRLRGLVIRDRAHRVTLGELPPAESLRLIRSIAPDARPDDASELAGLCGHLPLALAIAAEHAARRRPDQLGGLIEQMRKERLDAFEGADESGDLRAIFSWSHRALPPEAARLFELLGLYPGADFDVPAVAALHGAPWPDTRRLLTRLADLHLVNDTGDGRYEMHDLVRSHATELANRLPDEVRTPALDRLFSWYLHSSQNARLKRDDRESSFKVSPLLDRVTPMSFDHATEAIKWYDVERRNLASVIRLARATGRDRCTYELVESCEGDLSGRDLDLLTELLTLSLDSCTRLDERLPEAFTNSTLGMRYNDQGDDCEKAVQYFERALELLTAEGHELGQSRVLGNLAIAHDKLGHHHLAVELFEQTLVIKRRIGDEAGEARVLGNLAEVYGRLGRRTDQPRPDLPRPRPARRGRRRLAARRGHLRPDPGTPLRRPGPRRTPRTNRRHRPPRQPPDTSMTRAEGFKPYSCPVTVCEVAVVGTGQVGDDDVRRRSAGRRGAERTRRAAGR
jgi:tetratricopeptide (TPR) repeat protein